MLRVFEAAHFLVAHVVLRMRPAATALVALAAGDAGEAAVDAVGCFHAGASRCAAAYKELEFACGHIGCGSGGIGGLRVWWRDRFCNYVSGLCKELLSFSLVLQLRFGGRSGLEQRHRPFECARYVFHVRGGAAAAAAAAAAVEMVAPV